MCGIIRYMINTINSDLIRGHIDTIILSVLHEGDRYGYDILGEIEKKSGGQYVLKQPTLYSCLKRLETQGFIYKYWGTETNGGRRTYYSLTEMGKELFLKNKDEWKYSRGVIDRLISTSDDVIEDGTIVAEPESAAAAETEAAAADGDESPAALSEQSDVSESETNDEAEEKPQEETADTETETAADIEESDSDEDDTEQPAAMAADEESQALRDSYAEVVADAEKRDVLSETDNTSVYSAPLDRPLAGYSYADRLEHEPPQDTATHDDDDEDESFGSSYFANDASENDDEDDIDYEYTYDNDEDDDEEIDAEVEIKPVTDKPFYTEDDFRRTDNNDIDERQVSMFELFGNDAGVLPPPKSYSGRSEPVFRSYDEAELSEETDRELVVGREYKNIIRQLLTGDAESEAYYSDLAHTEQPPEPEREEPAPAEVAAAQAVPAEFVSDETSPEVRQDADFDNLLLSVRSMGDDIRIRTHNGNTDKEYSGLYRYYSNKLLMYKYGILFAIMILEIIIPYFIIKFGCNITIAGELPVLVISVVGSALLPVYAFSAYLIDPFKQKRYDFDLKTSLLYRLGIMVLMLVLVYAANVVFYMDISFEAEYAFSLVSPALLCTNIPLSALIFKALYDSGSFAVK